MVQAHRTRGHRVRGRLGVRVDKTAMRGPGRFALIAASRPASQVSFPEPGRGQPAGAAAAANATSLRSAVAVAGKSPAAMSTMEFVVPVRVK